MVGPKKKSKKPNKPWQEEPSESRSITPSPTIVPVEKEQDDTLSRGGISVREDKDNDVAESPLLDVDLNAADERRDGDTATVEEASPPGPSLDLLSQPAEHIDTMCRPETKLDVHQLSGEAMTLPQLDVLQYNAEQQHIRQSSAKSVLGPQLEVYKTPPELSIKPQSTHLVDTHQHSEQMISAHSQQGDTHTEDKLERVVSTQQRLDHLGSPQLVSPRLTAASLVGTHDRPLQAVSTQQRLEHIVSHQQSSTYLTSPQRRAAQLASSRQYPIDLPGPRHSTDEYPFIHDRRASNGLPSRPAQTRTPTLPRHTLSTSPGDRSSGTSNMRRTSLLDFPPHFMPPDHKDVQRTVRLDTLSDAGDQAAAVKAYDVVLVGTQGALDVYRVLPEKMDVIARLHGLRGMVLDAKIVPVVTTDDAQSAIRPLVALLIHGRVDDPWIKYQTTLEIYSLKTQEHVATLFKSLPVLESPEPVGALKIDANGSYLALSSGTSGEVFVFKDYLAIGKFWTTVQDRALLALGKRWLVIVCPDSLTVSIQGSASAVGQPYGLSSYNAPMQPPITADVDGISQGVLSRLSRQAAQEVLKASRKGVELGLSGWKEFTNPSPPRESEFPPTMAPEIKKQDQPAVISIIDLHRPGPICTFALERGCSFLSLSPDLRLATTDRAGEVTDVWEIGSTVKCVQRIERNSPSSVVGASWQADYLALQTARTIHLHDVREKVVKSATWAWDPTRIRASGGRMLVKGLAQGFSFAKSGVHDAWHADDNKIRVSGDVRWIRDGLAVANTTNVYVYSVAQVEKGLKVEHGRRDFALPDTSGPGFWALRLMKESVKVEEQDEIDTNPVYCPFHVDRRVSLLVYTPMEKDVWCFGDVLPIGVKVNTEQYDEFEGVMERSVFRVDE